MTDATPAPPASRGSRCWTLHAGEGVLDVQVTAAEEDDLAAVLAPLGRLLGTAPPTLWSGSAPLPPELPLAAPQLRHGAVLGLDGPGPRDRAGAGVLELHVTGGADAGRTVPLGSGVHVLGRDRAADLVLDDPDVSRRHAAVAVTGAGLTVADLGSTNGTRLEQHAVGTDAVPWPPGTALRLGTTGLAVTGPGAAPARLSPAGGGRLTVHPAPRLGAARPEVEVPVPPAPSPARPRKLSWPPVLLPAVAGAVMAAVLHTPTFLFLAVLGPVVAVASWWADRSGGRRAHRQELAEHAVALRVAEERLAAAVAADRRAAEAATPDLAALVTAARRRSSPLWSRRAEDGDALVLRLGTGRCAGRVTRVDDAGGRERVPVEDTPVVLDLRATGALGVVGPRAVALGVLRALVGQLAVLHPPGAVDLLLAVAEEHRADWSWARWLPHLSPGAGRPPGWTVVVVDGHPVPRPVEQLVAAHGDRVVVLAVAGSAAALPVPVEAVLRSSGELGERAVLAGSGAADSRPFVVDRLPADVAAGLARDLAPLRPGTPDGTLPRTVRLRDLPPTDRATGDPDAWPWSRSRTALAATLGVSAEGPLVVDLCRSGPHVLVAGTTGAGKSELLQTLVAGLALAHPPDRCSFLLVDYKGGAAFAEAAALPHTVGVLTDLDGTATARALRSLSAELTRREALLARHGVADLAGLPDDADLARLVIVVDEFATLAEELPAFVPGLVGIAQRGRSLGVHLVLATQRPAGVVSAEIRANCTLRLCLRTTDEADSRDVLGTADAAHLPVDLPGRALLRSGSGSPTAFQVARVAGAADAVEAAPEVRRWEWPHRPRPVRPGTEDAPTDLARITAALVRRAAAGDMRPPSRPWCPPLPDVLPPAALGTAPPGRAVLRLGLVDRPDRQRREPLELDLDEGGCWLALGGPRSGRTTLLRAVLGAAVAATGPEELHVHVLDHGGGPLAAEADRLPHAGTCVGGDDALRTVRLVDRLSEEVVHRRSGDGPGRRPRLLLLVDGVEQLLAVLDDADPARGSAGFLRLLRDGAAAGLTCVVTGDRAVPGGRLAAVARQRLLLPLADRADYAVAGVPAADVPSHRPPGRALLGEQARECQLVLPDPVPAGPVPGRRGSALRIPELPPDPVLEASTRPGAGTGPLLAVGPGGDEGGVLTVDLRRAGGLLVVGPPGSGRSAALDAFAADLPAQGVAVARVRRVPGAGSGAAEVELDAGDPAALEAWLGTLAGRPAALVADDVGPAVDWPVLALPAAVRTASLAVIAAGTASDLAGHFQGPLAALRRGRSGLLLRPGPAEADLLGIRLPRTPVPLRPGSGWLVAAGVPARVQVARRRA